MFKIVSFKFTINLGCWCRKLKICLTSSNNASSLDKGHYQNKDNTFDFVYLLCKKNQRRLPPYWMRKRSILSKMKGKERFFGFKQEEKWQTEEQPQVNKTQQVWNISILQSTFFLQNLSKLKLGGKYPMQFVVCTLKDRGKRLYFLCFASPFNKVILHECQHSQWDYFPIHNSAFINPVLLDILDVFKFQYDIQLLC